MAAVRAEQDWILHTPGGGPLDSRCPCLKTELCPRIFGDSELDVRHFGHIPICMDSRQVRCCGASFSMEVSGVPGVVTGSRHEHGATGQREGGANNTGRVETKPTQLSQTGPANNSQATPTVEIFVAGNQQKGTYDSEGYSDSSNTTAEKKNDFNVSAEITASDASSQQTAELQKGSNTHHSDSVLVFPWNTAAKFASTEPEVTFLVYNSSDNGNDTNDWDSTMNGYGSPINDNAEINLFESESEKNDYLTETTTVFDTEAYKGEMEYLVASGSENRGIAEDIEMQQDSEGHRNDNVEENEEEKGGDTDDEQYNVDESDIAAPGQTLINGIQIKGPNIPKRSFVSENLKMRISQLATGEQRRKPDAGGKRGLQDRHRRGPPSGRPSHPTTEVEKQTTSRKESVTNRPREPALPPAKTIIRNPSTQSERYENLPVTSVGRKTARLQLLQPFRSKAKHSTSTDQDRTTTAHASNSQNMLSALVYRNYTLGSGVAETAISQPQRSGLRQVSAEYQMQEDGPEMALSRNMQIHLKRHSEIEAELANGGRRNTNNYLFTIGDNRKAEKTEVLASNTKLTGIEEVKTSESGLNGAVEHNRRPAAIRKTTEASRSTFGLRTRTRDRSFATQSRVAGGGNSRATTFGHNQQVRGVAEVSSQSAGVAAPRGINLASSLETDTSGSAHEDISTGGTGLINIIGPIPKGFTDPVTTQNIRSAFASGPLFQLPYNIQPEPFRNAIPRPTTPLIATPVTLSESARPPSSAVTSSSHDANVRRQPHSETTATFSRSPNTSNVSPHGRRLHPQNHLASGFSASQIQLYLTAPTHEIVKFRQSPFHSSPPNEPVAAAVHSSHDDLAVRAKTVPLPQMTSVQKFLSFPDQQLRQPGTQQESVGAQQSSKHAAERRPAPHLFAVYQQDAVRHAAQVEYTNKLQEYYQQLLNYNKQQHLP